jgi:hypothetical protein
MDSTGFNEFFSQIAGLLVVTAVVGVLWIASLVVIFQRGAERRRRKRQGLPPPPTFMESIRGLMGEKTATSQTPSQTATTASPEDEDEFPDLGLDFLLDDIPLPDEYWTSYWMIFRYQMWTT